MDVTPMSARVAGTLSPSPTWSERAVAEAAVAACRTELPGLGPVAVAFFGPDAVIPPPRGPRPAGRRQDGWADRDAIHLRSGLPAPVLARVARHEVAHAASWSHVARLAETYPLERQQTFAADESLAERYATGDPAARAELAVIVRQENPMEPPFRIVARPSTATRAASLPPADAYPRWQAVRAAYDGRHGIARMLPLATRAPMQLPSAADRAWVRRMLAKRRAYLSTIASRLGLDPTGAMASDWAEAALTRIDEAIRLTDAALTDGGAA